MDNQSPDNKQLKPNFWQVIMSVSAALFGVQTDKNRQRDFQGGNIIHYIVAGIIGVTLMVLGLIFVVSSVLP
jgi:hypothetical protein